MSKNDGSGHYYRNGKRVDITWGDKISDGVKKSYEGRAEERICTRCGKSFLSPANTAKYCSYRCRKKANYDDLPALEKKAAVLGANLLMGRGKREALVEMMDEAIDRPCPYCKEIITLENLTIDHIEAYGSTKDRRNKKENKAIRQVMDRRENLQVICVRCNADKGDFDDDEFRSLLLLDEAHPGIVRKLKRRLAQAKRSWGR